MARLFLPLCLGFSQIIKREAVNADAFAVRRNAERQRADGGRPLRVKVGRREAAFYPRSFDRVSENGRAVSGENYFAGIAARV
jgi:hypothetical protein